ncbi:MAG: flagellar basal body protein [Hyphomonadaceae bacterium]
MSDTNQMSVFSLMKARMQMLGERQKVIAQNVANVSTPGYVPSDINQDGFAATLQRMAGHSGGTGLARTAMTATQAGHMAPPHAPSAPGLTTMKSPRLRNDARRQRRGGRGADDEDRRNPNGFRDHGWPVPEKSGPAAAGVALTGTVRRCF